MTFSRILAIAALATIITPDPSAAQEVCFTDANGKFDGWRASAGALLDELAAKYEASSSPYTELIQYKGMMMPIAAALIIEGEEYGKLADAVMSQVVGEAEDCSKKTRGERGVYDFAREYLGITTIFPERVTRIDFEQLRRGNIAGGKKSVIREFGRTFDQVFNPFRW